MVSKEEARKEREKEDEQKQPFRRVAALLSTRRLALGLSQDELALRADVSQSLVSQLERGVRDPAKASFSNLLRLLETLNITLRALLEHMDERSPELEGYLQQELARESAGLKSTLIPLYDDADSEPIDTIAIPSSWLTEGRFASFRMSINDSLSDVIVRLQKSAKIGDLVVAYVPDRGLVAARVTVDSAEDARLLKRKKPDLAQLIGPGAVIKGKVKEIRNLINGG